MDNNNKWDELSLTEKSEIMKQAVANGITDLNEIKQTYNEYADGGSMDNPPNQLPEVEVTAQYPYEQRVIDTMNNSSPEFLERLRNNDRRSIHNPDGTFSTHVLGSADNIVFPEIMDVNGKLIDNRSMPWQSAMRYAIKNNDYIEFPTEGDARYFGEHYKKYFPKFFDNTFADGGNLFKGGGYIPSASIKRDIANFEGSSMKTNRSFEAEAKDFNKVIPLAIRNKLSQKQLDALYSYGYNVGMGNLKNRVLPTLTAYTQGKAGADDVAASMWASKDIYMRGLQRRRTYERNMFTGNSPVGTRESIVSRAINMDLSGLPTVVKFSGETPKFQYDLFPPNPTDYGTPINWSTPEKKVETPTITPKEGNNGLGLLTLINQIYDSPKQEPLATYTPQRNNSMFVVSAPTSNDTFLDSSWFKEGGYLYGDGGDIHTTGGAGYVPSVSPSFINNTVEGLKEVSNNFTLNPNTQRYRFYKYFDPYAAYDNASVNRAINLFIGGPNYAKNQYFKDRKKEGISYRDTKKSYREGAVSPFDDAVWSTYLGIPKNKRKFKSSLVESKYKPTKGNSDETYYTIPIVNKTKDELVKEAEGLNIGDNKNTDALFGYNMGTSTLGKGYDDRGEYVSYYDKWDINPFHGAFSSYNLKDKHPLLYKVLPKDGSDSFMGFTNPVNFYNRIYLDDYYGLNKPSHATYLPEVVVRPNNNALSKLLYANGGPLDSTFPEVIDNQHTFGDGGEYGNGGKKNKYSFMDKLKMSMMNTIPLIPDPTTFNAPFDNVTGNVNDRTSSVAQVSYLLSRDKQQKLFEDYGYKRVYNDYGTVKRAAESKGYPIYQKNSDDASRENLVPIGNADSDPFEVETTYKGKLMEVPTNWYAAPNKSLIEAGATRSTIYYNPDNGKYYQKAWDLNDYGGNGGSTADIFGKFLDTIGNPVVVTSGIQEVLPENINKVEKNYMLPYAKKHYLKKADNGHWGYVAPDVIIYGHKHAEGGFGDGGSLGTTLTDEIDTYPPEVIDNQYASGGHMSTYRIPKHRKVAETIKMTNGSTLTREVDGSGYSRWFRDGKYITPSVLETYKFYDKNIGGYRQLKNGLDIRMYDRNGIDSSAPVYTPTINNIMSNFSKSVKRNIKISPKQQYKPNGKYITLKTKGNMNLVDIPTNMLDSIAINTGRSNTNIKTNLGLVGKESTFGGHSHFLNNPWSKNEIIDPHNLTNNHSYFTSPEDDYITSLYKYIPGHLDKDKAARERKAKEDLKHHNGIPNSNRIPHYSSNIMADAFKRYTVSPSNYNRGQGNYIPMVNAIGNEVWNEPHIQNWWNTEGKYYYNKGRSQGINYTYADGGSLDSNEDNLLAPIIKYYEDTTPSLANDTEFGYGEYDPADPPLGLITDYAKKYGKAKAREHFALDSK